MKKQNLPGLLCLLTTVVLFSTLESVSKGLLDRVDPFQITFWRFLLGGFLLWLLCAVRKDLHIDRSDLLPIAVTGLIGMTLSMNILQYSLSLPGVKAAAVAVIFSSNPVFVLLFQSMKEKRRLTGLQWGGLAVCVAGLAVLFVRDLFAGVGSPLALLLALIASALYGLYTVAGRDLAVKYGSLKYNAYSFLIGAVLMIPVLLVMGLSLVPTDMSIMPTMIYLSLFVTGIAYWTYFTGLKKLGAGKGSLVFFLKPPMATIVAWVLLGEQPGLLLIGSVALILTGLAMVTRKKERKA